MSGNMNDVRLTAKRSHPEAYTFQGLILITNWVYEISTPLAS